MGSFEGVSATASSEVSEAKALPVAPMVSVIMLAYNHGPYLADAIEGVIMQEAGVPIELLIGEDCSSDDTRLIALRYQRENPGLVRVIYSDANVGMHQNLRRLLLASRGEYLALCEGDDYWTARHKLRSQVDILCARREVSLVFHAADIIDHASRKVIGAVHTGTSPRDYTLSEIILGGGGLIPTASMVLRREAMVPLDRAFFECDVADYPIAMWAAGVGVCHSLPEKMCVYRQGALTSWTSMSESSVESEWAHAVSAMKMLEEFPVRAGRPDAKHAVRKTMRRYIRQLHAQYGSIAMDVMPGRKAFDAYLTWHDRLFLFGCDDPRSLRSKVTRFVTSRPMTLKKWWIERILAWRQLPGK